MWERDIKKIRDLDILVITRDKAFRNLVKAIGGRHNWRSFRTGNYSEGMTEAERLGFNIAFVDLKGPRIDGLKYPLYMAKQCPDMPIIIQADYTEVEHAVALMWEGIPQFIYKPFDVTHIPLVIYDAIFGSNQILPPDPMKIPEEVELKEDK